MIGRPAEEQTAEADAEATGEQDDLPRRGVETGTDERRAHPSRQSRRSVLQGMAGIGVGAGTATPGSVLQHVEGILSQVDEDDLNTDPGAHDPHTVATFDAIIDAVVPNTQDDPIEGKLGEELDEIHQYGGLDAEMTPMCIDILNDFISPEVPIPKVASTEETVPLSQALAAVLDTAASELVARGGNEDQPQPARFGPAGGTFASLSREDRFRALYDVEHRADQLGQVDDDRYSRTGSFVVALAVVFPPIIYYSDMNGYDDFIDTPPSERDFDPAAYTNAPEGYDTLLGWAQTGYPGVTDGHDVLLGYELDEDYEPTSYGRRRPGGPARTEPEPDDENGGEEASGGSDAGGGEPPEPPFDPGQFPLDPTEWLAGGDPL